MAVLLNPETGQSFEVSDDEAPNAMRSMGLVQATPEQIDWLKKDQEYRAKPLLDRAAETGEAAALGLMKSGRELGKLRLDDSGLAQSLFPEQALQVSGAIQQHQAERDAILADPRTAELAERHPMAHTIGVDAPALFVSGGVGGLAGIALESVGVGVLEEAVGSTDEGRDFDIGNAATIAAQDLAFSGLAHAATKVASRVGNLLMFGAGNTTAKNVKRGLDESAGPVVPDDVRFDGPLLEAETRSRRTAAAQSPGMPPGPERDDMLRRAAADLNDQVKSEGGDLIDSTLSTAKASASVADEAVARRIDETLRETTPAQTAWSADATRKLDEMRTALDATADEAAAPFVARAREVADEAIAAIDGSGESASWFRASSAARETLDSLADDMAKAGLPAQQGIEAAREFLGRSLTDRALFGGAAEMHAGLHGVARDKIASAVKNAGGDMRTALSEFVSADAATRQTMRAPIQQAIEGFEELARAHERFGTGSPKTIEGLRESASKLRRGLQLADDVQSAQRSAPKAAPKPPPATASKEPDYSRADTLAEQIRQRAAPAAKAAGVKAAQKIVDYAAGPGRAVYDDAVSDALKGAIQSVAAIGGLAVLGPPGFVAGWLGARSLGKKYAPEVGQQILDAAQRYVKKHGADTAGAALLATAALGDEGEDDDSDTLAASVGGLFFARRFAERALGAAGRGAKAAGAGVMKASEAVTGAVDAATGKAADVVGQVAYKAGRAVGEATGAGLDAVAKGAADEELVKSAIKSGVRDPKRWLVRNTRGRIADKAAEYFGPRISGAATKWLEKRHGKTAQEVVNEAVSETAEAGRRDSALLEEHSAQSAAMVEDVGAQIRAALNETAEQKARALQAFPQRIGGDAHAQRQLLSSAVDELSAALGKVSDGTTAKVAIEFANAAKEAIINARTARDRFRIGMQLTETLVHHTAEVGDGEMAKVFGAYADKMWEAMGQREVWMGARELQREAKRVAKKRESIISKISAGEKLGIAALVGSAAVDDEDTAAALAATGGMGALVGKGKLMGDAVDPRQLGTIPPKGKAKRPDGPIAAKPERDATPTKFYPNSNQARNEYGENMRPYREAQRADNTRMAQLAKDYGLAGAGVGAAAMSDDESGAAMAGAGLFGIGSWKVGREWVNLSHVADPIAKLREMGAKPALIEKVVARIEAAKRPLVDVAIDEAQHASVAAKNDALWSPAEREAISDYQSEGYRDVNAQLRGEGEGADEAIASVTSALDKAVAAGNVTPGTIWRGVDLDEKQLAQLEQSSHVMAQGVLSAATNDKRARVFSPGEYGKKPVIFKIEQQNGVPITASGEEEILMRPGTKFEIVGIGREKYTGGPYSKSDDDWRYIDTVRLRETGMVPEKSRRSFLRQHGGKLAAAGGLVALGVAASGDAQAAEPEEAPEPDDRTVAANRILAIDQAATQRIRHTARVLAGLAEPPSPEGLTTHLARFGAEHDDPRAAFEERKDVLTKSEISPALVYDVLGASMGDVASVSPELYQAATARLLDNFRYLRENLPPEVKTSLLHPRGMPVSESAMRDFATQWNTVMDPESVNDDIERGTVTHLQIETLRNAHADIYQQLRTEIIEEVGANFASIPTSTKMQLDILFQADGLAGPMFSSEAAAIIGAAGKAASQRKQPGPPQTGADDQDAAASSNGLEAIRSSVTNRGA